ncbi:multifunctional CCA protein [Steroidobacter agaridevorans]|uniref:Multifunctional CCA protein n=1 Tax=Steroidobacter agaridevorans TaxID=2695856 RepID=A0A829YCY2_9GAMM|nr:multifunctional CCA addition/repair protein [Steroidobacter agaridevorans]GFE81224.1 multifunctional CCA protein [Steroidobacter agaridevorans]GFE88892.1 multifunctional CCA protein [Steroidobacter agaridevorans]
MKIYLVGGAVRDELLGLAVRERDWVVVGACPEELLDQGFKPVGKDFPVFLHPQTSEEYALARTERKTGPGYRGFDTMFSPDVTLEQDLERRDLTINAIARDEATGALVDPFHGQRDLQERWLRHVSPAFVEDPVRVLRLARFAARFAPLGFRVAPETMELLREIAARGELDALVSERVWQETQRALEMPAPRQFFEVLREGNALPVIFPEIDALFGIPQPEQWHPEIDTGVHTMMVLDQATKLTDDPVVRFAALVHDLGKATTPTHELPRHIAHEERGVGIVEELCDRLRIPNAYRELGVLVSRYHLHMHKITELRPQTVLELLERLDSFRRPARFEQFLLACEADARGRKGLEQRDYPQPEYLRRAREVAAAATLSAEEREGLQGFEIAKRLHDKRIHALKELKRQHEAARSETKETPPDPER